MTLIKIKYAALAAGLLLAGATVAPLVHALSQRQTVRQISPLAQTRRQAFQIGLTEEGCNKQAREYNAGVANIRTILNQPSVVSAEIEVYSHEVPHIRREQAADYKRISVILESMEASSDVYQWYSNTGALFLKPLPYSQAVNTEAKADYAAIPFSAQFPADPQFGTEAQLATDLAAMTEMKTVHEEAAAHQTRVTAWLAQLEPNAMWDIQLGSYAADLHRATSGPGIFSVRELTHTANSLLQTAPADTPEAVRSALQALVSDLNRSRSGSPSDMVLIEQGSAITQQINRAYDSLCSAYRAAAPSL